MKEVILKIGGMGCDTCRVKLEEYLNKHDGVNALVDLENNLATIKYDDNKYSVSLLEKYIEEAGYESLGEK